MRRSHTRSPYSRPLRASSAPAAPLNPPRPRDLSGLSAHLAAFTAGAPARDRAETNLALRLMLDACRKEGRPFEGWWPGFGAIRVHEVGELSRWSDARVFELTGSFFRFAHERGALDAAELVWLLANLEETRRGLGLPAEVVELPMTPEFDAARMGYACQQAARLSATANLALGRLDERADDLDPLLIAGMHLAMRDGVPVRFERLEPRTLLERVDTSSEQGAGALIYAKLLRPLARALERLPHVQALGTERAAALAEELRALAADIDGREAGAERRGWAETMSLW